MMHLFDAPNGRYPILCEPDALKKSAELIGAYAAGRVLIVTDDGVPERYIRTVRSCFDRCCVTVLPEGEGNKGTDGLLRILNDLYDNGFDRGDCIVALGGGVVCDMAGFAASIYMRGIAWFSFPTTLLAMVDASVGGKTAVNYRGVKNLIGSFYPPKGVFADILTLDTLAPRQVANGLAEAIKTAALFDADFFFRLQSGASGSDYSDIIDFCIEKKIAVAQKDPFDRAERKLLNFGHTVGHAIEANCGGKYLHGECVGAGMLYMCGEAASEEIRRALIANDLPVDPEFDLHGAMACVGMDKKSQDGTVTAVWLEEIGCPRLEKVSKEEIFRRMQDRRKE